MMGVPSSFHSFPHDSAGSYPVGTRKLCAKVFRRPRPKKLSRAVADLSYQNSGRYWVKTVHNVGGLACILWLTGPNN